VLLHSYRPLDSCRALIGSSCGSRPTMRAFPYLVAALAMPSPCGQQ
jgi:hypothetical protein